MRSLVDDLGWSILCQKNGLITALIDESGNKLFYELGRHNIEIATIPMPVQKITSTLQRCLDQLYEIGNEFDAYPYFQPILQSKEDLLIIPDERDANWLKLDGRKALMPLACISSVQFTISVAVRDAINILNRLGSQIYLFLDDFPQDVIWNKYIHDSWADYLPNRYGGPLQFSSLDDYCRNLIKHDVVQGEKLVSFADIESLDIPLYIRSIWWHFRLKRYDNSLCIEIRPMARRSDDFLSEQLNNVLDIVG